MDKYKISNDESDFIHQHLEEFWKRYQETLKNGKPWSREETYQNDLKSGTDSYEVKILNHILVLGVQML